MASSQPGDRTPSPSSAPMRRASDKDAGELAKRLTQELRAGDGSAAEETIDQALAAGLAPEAVHAMVVAPAMVAIGDLWEAGEITVADEHLATSISHRALIRVFDAITRNRTPALSRERILLAAVEGQRHVLGLRMISDVLEGAGFEVLFLGADVPVSSLGSFVARHTPAVAGLGIGIRTEVSRLADSLAAVHAASPETRVMLGGLAVPEEVREAGYPVVGSSMEVVDAVERLLAAPAQPLPDAVAALRSTAAAVPQDPGQSDATAERLAEAADSAIDVAREQVRRAANYRDLAFRDSLTGLANRRAFEDGLRELALGTTVSGAVLMLDVDDFKDVNDSRGHAAGDEVLCGIAEAVERSVRPGDVAARVGGDEFAVILAGATMDVAHTVGERIRDAVAAAGISTLVSIGAAPLTDDPRGALLAADAALYEAKRASGNRVVVTGAGAGAG